MTASPFFEFALIAILAVVAGAVVSALLQVRRTARAVEELVRGVAPGAGGAATHLDSVLGRMDRALEGVETSTRSVAGAFSDVSSFVRNLRQPTGGSAPSWFAALSNIAAGAAQAWSAVSSKRSGDSGAASSTKEGGQKDV